MCTNEKGEQFLFVMVRGRKTGENVEQGRGQGRGQEEGEEREDRSGRKQGRMGETEEREREENICTY